MRHPACSKGHRCYMTESLGDFLIVSASLMGSDRAGAAKSRLPLNAAVVIFPGRADYEVPMDE